MRMSGNGPSRWHVRVRQPTKSERAAAAPKFMPVVRTAPIAVVAQKRQVVTTPPPLPAVDEDTQVDVARDRDGHAVAAFRTTQ